MADLSSVSGFLATGGGRSASPLRSIDEPLARIASSELEAKLAAGRRVDSVELSDRARESAALQAAEHSDTDIRADLVERIKAEIADGSYDTPEKLAAAAWKVTKSLNTTA